MSTNVDKTLETLLMLIARDTAMISELYEGKVMEPMVAQTLCRYASTLASIKDGRIKEVAKEKQELNRLSTEELLALYNKTTTKE